jgi:hypothetical protein
MNPALSPSVGIAAPVLSHRLERLLCILVVAAAVKAPLGIPLYLNSLLPLLGLFSLVALQVLPLPFLWLIPLIGFGVLAAGQLGILSDSGPRLVQLLLTVLASALITRLDPKVLGRYLALLVPLFLILLALEPLLLPETLQEARRIWGANVPRQRGLHGEPNYNAMLYGVIGMILAQQRPRWLGIPPFLAALPSLSRGLIAAIFGWLGAKAVGRQAVWLAPLAALVLCAQPLMVLAVDSGIDAGIRQQLNRLTSNRYQIWVAHAGAGISGPLGVGYFNAQTVISTVSGESPARSGRQAHSLYLQVFGEFGWLGYLAFVGFVVHTSLTIARRAPTQLPLLMFLLTGYAFLNGLTDWPFWVGIGYVLAHAYRTAPATSG